MTRCLLRPSAIASALLVSTALVAPARAVTPSIFSPAWHAARSGGAAALGTAAASAASAGASLAQVQQSIANLQRTAQAIAAAAAAQNQARQAALALPPNVPDGLAPGGLQPVPGFPAGSPLWQGASLPTQSGAPQRPTVTVRQTSKQAVLTWQTFNVGRNTTLAFDQSAGGAAANTWVALNRVFDPNGQPSQILGAITAPGQVYVIDNNGVIFGATAQVNTGALIASSADINTAAFLATGVYSPPVNNSGFAKIETPSFTGATGAIMVEPGAQIATNPPASLNAGGGSVLLLGSRVSNAGLITTPRGQAVLAAGRDFELLPGFGSSNNADANATVQGYQVAVTAGAGVATNTGLIAASDGDITMVGHSVTQAGVAVASTGLGQRGTVHLLTNFNGAASDASASVTLAPGSVTAITIDSSSDTAIEALRSGTAVLEATTQAQSEVNDWAGLPDVRDLSRIEITSDGSVGFGAGSLALATSGQIAVAAHGSVLMAPGATADVSGLVGVTLPQSANLFQVSIEPYNLRDSPVNRDTTLLSSQSVTIDARTLLFVPPVNGDANARYYTGGGLLEVGGELGNVGHTIAEYSTTGGTVEIQAPAVIAQPGATVNLAGGSIQYQAGPVKQTWLIGADGRLYNLNSAADSIVYAGVFGGFQETHPHWNATELFQNPLIAPAYFEEPGYTVGHDAGSLEIAATTVAFAGTIDAGTVVGARQNARPITGDSGLLVTQTVLPQSGTLDLAAFTTSTLTPNGVLLQPGSSEVLIGPDISALAARLSLRGALPRSLAGRTEISAASLDADGLGGLLVESTRSIAISGTVAVADGGSITLQAPTIGVTAPLVARGGTVTLGVGTLIAQNDTITPSGLAGVTIGGSAQVDTRGVWSNALLQPQAIAAQAWINGGAVTVDTTGSITLAAGSTIDASAGGYVSSTGSIVGGAGGNIALLADVLVKGFTPINPGPSKTASLNLGGTVRSLGFTHGGALTLQAAGIAIGNGLAPTYAGELVLSPSLFASGFSSYTVVSATNVAVAAGTQLDVVEPVYQATTLSAAIPGGSDPDAAFQVVLPPLYLPDPLRARLTQRAGASLTLDAPGETPVNLSTGNFAKALGPMTGYGQITLGPNAAIAVDPGQSAVLAASLSATIDGAITAPGGTIEVLDADILSSANQLLGRATLLIGPDARLDAAGTAVTALDRFGRPYGTVTPGGVITLGNTPGLTTFNTLAATDAPIVIQAGAVIDASGAAAVIDLAAGLSPFAPGQHSDPVSDQTAGGTIRLASYASILADGVLRAAPGGPSAAGGTLDVALEGPYYIPPVNFEFATNPIEDPYLVARRIVVAQQSGPAAATAPLGVARLSVEQISAGGFGTVSLYARDGIVFDGNVTLAVAQAITLQEGPLAETAASGQVSLAAPYVLLSGSTGSAAAAAPSPGTVFIDSISTVPRQSILTIDADLIDIANAVVFGNNAVAAIPLSNGKEPVFSAPGFGHVNLVSTGDIRFLQGQAPTFASGSGTQLASYGSVSLTAAQVYPVTDAVAEVDAGLFNANYVGISSFSVFADNPAATLTIAAVANPADPPPLSVFGSLTLSAPRIEQGGVVLAPFGAIRVGVGIGHAGTVVTPSEVTVLPGSVTSVSAAGLTIPFGGTSDGVTYQYEGAPAPFGYVTGTASPLRGPSYGIGLTGQAIAIDAGATLDLQGGGTLTGAGFVAGRGGSTDTLVSPLLSFGTHSVTANPISASDAVYALLPSLGAAYAPPAQPGATSVTGLLPGAGQTVTVGAGVPGLPAGTYTLLPSYYALQPGGYRIELRSTLPAPIAAAQPLPNGSYAAAVTTGVANTGILSAVPISAIITPGATVLRYSQYDQQSYAAFATAQPLVSVFGNLRPVLPEDAGELDLIFAVPRARTPSLINAGVEDLAAAPGGYGGALAVLAANTADSLTIGGPDTRSPGAIVISAAALDAVAPASMDIGGIETVLLGNPPTYAPQQLELYSRNTGLTVAPSASLVAPQILLISNGLISVAPGATLDSIGRSATLLDSSSGLQVGLSSSHTSAAAVTNGSLLLQAPAVGGSTSGIQIASGATLYAGGTLAFDSPGVITLAPRASLGALAFSVSATDINLGQTAQAPAAAIPAGFLLSPQVLDTLLAGDPQAEVPALQTLDLTASQSVNFFGSTRFNGTNLKLFVLNTPGIYGLGSAGSQAVLNVGTLYWSGVFTSTPVAAGAPSLITVTPPPLVAAGGPGTGSGTLDINAQEIVFGAGPNDVPETVTPEPRAIFGFSTVNLTATQQIVAAQDGALMVYQTQGALQPDGTLTGTGGTLRLMTPLLTAAAAGTLEVTVGGALTLSPGAGLAASAARPDAAGGEIMLTARSITDSTAISLPSGRAVLDAASAITLAAGARLDVGGESDQIVDQTVSGPGGEVILSSTSGSVTEAAGASIAFGGAGDQAGGTLSISAAQGAVSLGGALTGGGGDAADSGGFTLDAGVLPSFAALNQALTAGGVFGARSFEIGSGDLVITTADQLRAHDISVSLDGGSLTVDGLVDASGTRVGSITLAGKTGLTLTGDAVLAAQGSVLVADSFGQPIDAANRAEVSLTAAAGTLSLLSGASIDLASADGVARGDLELNAPRASATGGAVAAAAPGGLAITGAATIALNGFWSYHPADGIIVQTNLGAGGTTIDPKGIGLDQIDADNRAFDAAASAGLAQTAALAGLVGYGAAFHLRPGVIIDSSATRNGDLSVDGDLDLSGLRYGPGATGGGAGEPGVLILRAAGNLGVYGSISDGFARAPATPDQAGWRVFDTRNTFATTVLAAVTLDAGTVFSNDDIALSYSLPVAAGATINAGMAVPQAVTLTSQGGAGLLVTEAWRATADITLGGGGTIAAGATIPAGTVLPAGSVLAAGSTLPDSYAVGAMSWKAGNTLGVFAKSVKLSGSVVVQRGGLIPSDAKLNLGTAGRKTVVDERTRPAGSGGAQGSIDALAAMLPPGSMSWSMDLVAGANLAASDPNAVLPLAQLAAEGGVGGAGNLVLDDAHYGVAKTSGGTPKAGFPGFSVIRTGTGSLTLAAGGSIDQLSPYGIYTAGTQSSGVPASDEPISISPEAFPKLPAYQAVIRLQLSQDGYEPYYPTDGGNLLIATQGSLSVVDGGAGQLNALSLNAGLSNLNTGWLWEQGTPSQPASWWINFGSYAQPDYPSFFRNTPPPIAGFTGFGTLGGGNVVVRVGGDAGATSDPQAHGADGITIAVGSTGRVTSVQQSGTVVTGGALVQTGGGDLLVQVGGALLSAATGNTTSTITDTRGAAVVDAGSVGIVQLGYGQAPALPAPVDPRFNADVQAAEVAYPLQGITLAIGDGIAAVTTRADLSLADAIDPGREGNNFFYASRVSAGASADVLQTGFSLWQPTSGISLLSAGGSISPNSNDAPKIDTENGEGIDEYPPQLSVAAQHGSIYFYQVNSATLYPVELAPSASGELSLLAGGSIYGPAAIGMSGAPAGFDGVPNPFKPAYWVERSGSLVGNLTDATSAVVASELATSLYVFEADTPTGPLHPPGAPPIRVYAGSGDIVDLTVGLITNVSNSGTVDWYGGDQATLVVAGNDIVNMGYNDLRSSAAPSPSLFVNEYPSDISVLRAGRDIIFANADVAGPGLLYVQAGRDLYQGSTGVLRSIGEQVVNASIPASDVAGGAAITALAGVGSAGPDWTAFAELYFNDANLANPALLLTDPANAGKVQQTYGAALLAWLQQNTGYTGDQAGALAAFLALPVERQSEFTLPVYFDELRLSGRQFTDPTSRFYKSYARGKQAASVFLPGGYQGNITLFATPATVVNGNSITGTAAAITTNYGGDITLLAPGGDVSLGTTTPGVFPSPYGVITFGQGDVDIYAQGSVLLGTSRIFTTFGGGITVWSADGDINAGQGTKSAVVAQPFSLAYDTLGDITLSPQSPSTGAGIATLNEIPGTVPGDVDLIAPQGTIDAGEAGIRSSGNANLAALVVANAANIQVQGKVTGTPVIAVPNIGALAAASAVGNAAQNTAQQNAFRHQPGAGSESIITVEVLGFGGG